MKRLHFVGGKKALERPHFSVEQIPGLEIVPMTLLQGSVLGSLEIELFIDDRRRSFRELFDQGLPCSQVGVDGFVE